jgi:hypothetical protein
MEKHPDPHATGDHLYDPDLMPALEDDQRFTPEGDLFTHLISPTIRMKGKSSHECHQPYPMILIGYANHEP